MKGKKGKGTRRRAARGKKYYYLSTCAHDPKAHVSCAYETGHPVDDRHWEEGNYYLTPEEVKEAAKKHRKRGLELEARARYSEGLRLWKSLPAEVKADVLSRKHTERGLAKAMEEAVRIYYNIK